MKQKSIVSNYTYNLMLTIVNMIFPLVTAPYISSVLGAEYIGRVNFATSIINWCIIFTSFGIPRYGVITIAKNRDNKKKVSEVLYNLLIIQIILTLVIFIPYIFLVTNYKNSSSDYYLYLLMGLMLILNIFNIDWFYQGIEEYKYITIRNVIIKILNIFLMFIAIKEPKHYVRYAGLSILGNCLNNYINFIIIRKYVYVRKHKMNLYKYIKELKIYFFITLVISIYTNLDQIFIGTVNKVHLAYYLRSKVLLSVGLSFTNSLISILIPRAAYLINTDYNKYKDMLKDSIKYIYLFGIPCSIGLIMLSEEVMVMLGGKEFANARYSLQILSALIIILSIGGWQVNQILIPHGLQKVVFKLQMIAAAISLIGNSILIPQYSYVGAAIVWVLVESFLAISEAIAIKRKCPNLDIQYMDFSVIKYLVAGFVMMIFISIFKHYIDNVMLVNLGSTVIGALIYFITLFLLKDKVIIQAIKTIKER